MQAVNLYAQNINKADWNAGLHTVRFNVPGGMSIVESSRRDGSSRKAARNLAIPVLIVHAAHSDVMGQDEVDHLRALVPQAEYVRVDNASHMVVGDKNSE